jgi:hypothetical protein
MMDTTDRRTIWTAGLAGSVAVLAVVVALVIGAFTGAYCW